MWPRSSMTELDRRAEEYTCSICSCYCSSCSTKWNSVLSPIRLHKITTTCLFFGEIAEKVKELIKNNKLVIDNIHSIFLSCSSSCVGTDGSPDFLLLYNSTHTSTDESQILYNKSQSCTIRWRTETRTKHEMSQNPQRTFSFTTRAPVVYAPPEECLAVVDKTAFLKEDRRTSHFIC